MNQFYYSNNTNFTGHVQRNTVFENTVHPKQIVEQIPMTKEIGKMLPEFGLVNMNGRMYDSDLGMMLSPDNYVQDPFFPQNYNRYAYCWNNPLKYTDPSGDFVWFVVGGAILGGYIGGSIQQGTAAFWNWESDFYKQGDFWKSVGVGAIVGAGAGATLAAGLGATGTGLGAGFSGAQGGASSLGWNIASQGLITANINIASTTLQGGDLNAVFTSGFIGLGAGAIGGTVGHYVNTSGFYGTNYTGKWTSQSIRAQNITTSSLSGFGTRLASSYEQGQTGLDPWVNAFKGAAEGAYLGYLSSNTRLSDIGKFSKAGRYLSSFLGGVGTSVPGLGFTIAYYHATIASYQYLNLNVDQINPFITTTYMFGQFLNSISAVMGYEPLQMHQYYNKYIIGNYSTVIKPFFF